MESLHDIAVDNQQCARQAHIYSDVISGHNVNVLLKKLTLISIIFLPFNLTTAADFQAAAMDQGGTS